jgi:hypothetical protein
VLSGLVWNKFGTATNRTSPIFLPEDRIQGLDSAGLLLFPSGDPATTAQTVPRYSGPHWALQDADCEGSLAFDDCDVSEV